MKTILKEIYHILTKSLTRHEIKIRQQQNTKKKNKNKKTQ